MKLRRCSRAAGLITVTICLTVVVNSGCAPSMLTGLFVNHANAAEIDMLRLVESPPGHLNGSLEFPLSTLMVQGKTPSMMSQAQ